MASPSLAGVWDLCVWRSLKIHEINLEGSIKVGLEEF